LQALRLVSVITVGIVAIVSCGGDDDGDSSKGDFAEQTKAICAHANKEESALDPPDPGAREGTKYDDPDFQAAFNAIGHDALRRLRALPLPEEENPATFEEVLDSIDRLLSARDERIAAMRGENTRRQAAAIRKIDTAYFDLASSAGSLSLAACQGVGF
jgi:hypothetical protein